MFGRLVRKEIAHHLLDFRFTAVFALCALLAGLAMYTGVETYTRQLQEYQTVSETNRRALQENSLDQGRLFDLVWLGYPWNRRPEVLSPVAYGLSGALGRQVLLRYQTLPDFESSVFETDPIHLLFEVLDLSFIVKVVLSLCVLLFTYDAVCGEKEAGTLRLYASYPVSRSTMALSKLVGCTLAVLVPLVFVFLVSATVLALFPEVALTGADWARIASIMGVFTLYLVVFAAFGIFVSALVSRRLTAFLALLGLWALWIFVVPNVALDMARRLVPVRSYYRLQKEANALDWKIRKNITSEMQAYEAEARVANGDSLSQAEQERLGAAYRQARYKIETRGDAQYFSGLSRLQTEWRDRLRRRSRLVSLFSALSPLGAASFASMDLARTGFVQQERIEDALNAYLISLAQFVRRKNQQSFDSFEGMDLSDFPWFTYRDRDTLEACLARNAFAILNLALLALLGFAGAYVAILRYDVR